MNTRHLGYCTNVHAGSDLETTKSSLLQHAVQIRNQLCSTSPLDVGLWLSAKTLEEAQKREEANNFLEWLKGHFLRPYTLNGFPWGDFHDHVVKHRVYEPTWWDPRRLNYTLGLVDLLDALLPTGDFGTISTLPIAWGNPPPSDEQLRTAAAALTQVAERLSRLENESGRHIVLAIEPEPGCFFQRSADVVRFFDRYLDSELHRRFLGVCHDVCHASVMFESQSDVIEAYRSNSIHIAKVQISSNVQMLLEKSTAPSDRDLALSQLAAFAEDRYLHQTCVATDGGPPTFFEDLPEALKQVDTSKGTQDWRVHFHVPIHLPSLGQLQTGQAEIKNCLDALDLTDPKLHLEVETYAWNVLPEELKPESLNDGIVAELRWLDSELNAI